VSAHVRAARDATLSGMEHDLTLQHPVVTLRPLRVGDAAELATLSSAAPSAREDLRWHTSPLPLDTETARTNIEQLLGDGTTRAFAVRGTVAGDLRGITSFYDLAVSVPRVEIGHTHYGRSFWGGDTNPACKLLMLTHAFEAWGCVRVALRCDAANSRSVGAIRRLGAQPEGVQRNHRRRHDGTVADTAYFSITDAEWPEVRAGLHARVAP
jgi:RimJ/RimL family protein N-acetyltransferase